VKARRAATDFFVKMNKDDWSAISAVRGAA
jgi:hypothetical protein